MRPRKLPRVPLDLRGLAGREDLFRIAGGVKRDPAVDRWMSEGPAELRSIARTWFEQMRQCGDDVRELLHDGHPTACIGDAAFCCVAAFREHVNVGFFLGAGLPDPGGLLEGSGKAMRHVKLRPDRKIDDEALRNLIQAAYACVRRRLGTE
jgi:hypothetical protein